jgi:hypothetical protein
MALLYMNVTMLPSGCVSRPYTGEEAAWSSSDVLFHVEEGLIMLLAVPKGNET